MVLVDILIFLAVLGVLIFFHELGHFAAAKACGIYVDRFSLGMPPRLFGIRWGDTDYCIGALPLGGYVKMAGQEDAPLSEEEREETYGQVPPDRWFNNKPVWQRFIVILAGPMMNLVLAVLLYSVIAAMGGEVPENEVDNRIGMIQPDSPAAGASMYAMAAEGAPPDCSGPPDAVGWQLGDRIQTINGHRIRNIMDVAIDALLGAGEVLDVVVERTATDGTTTRYLSAVEPKVMEEDGRARFGVAGFNTALVSDILPGSPAEEYGLKTGDIIIRADGKLVDRETFVRKIEKMPEGETVLLEVLRDSEAIPITLQPETVGRLLGVQAGIPAKTPKGEEETAAPVIYDVSDEAKKTGLLPKDIIEKIDGQPATLELLDEIVRSNPGENLTLTIRRPAILFGSLRKESTETFLVPVAPVRAIGIRLGIHMVFRQVPPIQIVPEAFRLAYRDLARTTRTLQMLVTGAVSPKELGGPVMIYQVTTSAARGGLDWLMKWTAFISVNLCVFNLLPIPLLDGSLLVYLLFEGIRRKPLSIRVQERIQQVGLVLIVGLMLYVTFNDVSRLFTGLVPQ